MSSIAPIQGTENRDREPPCINAPLARRNFSVHDRDADLEGGHDALHSFSGRGRNRRARFADHAGAGAIPEQADHGHRAVCRGRADRRRRPSGRRAQGRTLGTTFVVENIGGAGGSIGMTRAALAQPDGYTIAVGNMGTQSAAPGALSEPEIRSGQELCAGRHRQLHAAGGRLQEGADDHEPQGLHRLREGARGSAISYGHAGVGSISHVAGLVFNAKFGLTPNLIPYRGTGPVLTDLVAGQIDLHRRPVAQRHPADQGRHHQGLCHRRAGAAGEPSGCADHQGGRRGFHLQRLERDGRAQGHAEGDRRQAVRGAEQGARRSGGQGALCRAGQFRAAGRRARAGRPAEARRSEVARITPVIKAANVKVE